MQRPLSSFAYYATLRGEIVAFEAGRGSHPGTDSNVRHVDEISLPCSGRRDNWQVSNLSTTKRGNSDDLLLA